MADRRQQPQMTQSAQPAEVSKIDALYSWLSYDLQRMRMELLNELKISSVQTSSLYQELKADRTTSTQAITQEIRYSYKQNQTIYDGLVSLFTNEVSEKLNALDEKVALIEQVYSLVKANEAVAAVADIDYNKIINGSAEKIIEALPYPEKVDYSRIAEIAEYAVEKAVEKALAALNIDAIANTLLEKLAVPAIDYERLSDMVASKLAASTEKAYEVVLDDDGVDRIADKVTAKVSVPDAIDYERVYQAAQAAQIMPEPVDYDRIAEIVEDKQTPTYDLVIDSEGIEAIATSVAEKVCASCATCEEIVVADATEEIVEEAIVEDVAEEVVEAVEEQPVEDVAEEIVEEIVEETVEETIEETVEEAVEETPVEEVVEEVREEENLFEVRKEIAVSVGSAYEEVDNQLIDAETGLVIRLKRSFTAKMRQSDEQVKGYYSDIKNELISYKKINSNVSWHGDRFNFGRETVAKINICGKTLCFYLALDPNDPEYKVTVYHQKDVGGQKAYESTPFMVKVKSDAAAKKALRLVGYLAEKVGAEKQEGFEAVDYVEEFKYQSTKQLFEDGYIKVTKEKKVDLDF